VTIWGHTHVHVEKDVVKKEWRVSTAKPPHSLLVTIPWADAFKSFTHAPDYSEAIETCQSHPTTALTRSEIKAVKKALEEPKTESVDDKKVVSMSDYRRKRGR
jgi:hypothetical protein